MKGRRYSDLICVALLIAVWLLAVFAVDPVGNFALNDDWAYASAVRALVEQRELRLSGWTATNLIAQLLWGALFCLPFGFSFTALRISTLVLALLGVLATYALLREAQAKPATALIGAATLAFGPIYFALSFTFMTDVPFTAAATLSSWLLLRGLRRGGRAAIVGGLALAMAAILIRQIGLAIPIAFAVAYIVKRGFGLSRLIEATIPVVLGFAVQTAYQGCLHWLDRIPPNFGKQIETLRTQLTLPWDIITGDAATIMFYIVVYTGFLLLPFLIVAYRAAFRSRERVFFFGAVGAAMALTIILKIYGRRMPLHGNVLTKGGIFWYGAPAPPRLWLLVTFLSCFGAVVLVAGLVRGVLAFLASTRSGFEAREPHVLGFALAAIATAFAPLPLLGLGEFGFYDRHLIVLLPWLMLLFVAVYPVSTGCRQGRAAPVAGVIALVSMAVFSIGATHDYLAVNRVRWVALADTMRRYHVGPESIDGGFEFNGWYLYHDNYVSRPDKSWYWVIGDDYVVQQSLRPGYRKLAEYPVNWWLPWSSGQVIVQRRMIATDLNPMARDPNK
jgi:Dolichyl-phosphate-mannose-protein mannosyltransferase